MNLIRNIFKYILFKLIPPKELANIIEQQHVERNEKALTMGPGSKLYGKSTVYNFRNDKSKITLGDNTHIRGELLTFAFGGSIRIGDNCFVGEGTRIWSADSIEIGNDVLISHNCNIIDTNSHELDHMERAIGFVNLTKDGHSKDRGSVVTQPIVIDDNAWISFQVSIMKGVKIGRGSIVAAGSVVTRDVEDFTLVGGNPAKILKKLSNDESSL